MICVATTEKCHREFQFTCPPLGKRYSLPTPDGTILFFTDHAYDLWEHESMRSKFQDGECISMTIRKRKIDSYYGWQGSPEGDGAADPMLLPGSDPHTAGDCPGGGASTATPSSSLSPYLDAIVRTLSERQRNSVGFARFAQHHYIRREILEKNIHPLA